MNSFAKAAGVPPDTVWDRSHIYKACLLEEMMRGCGCTGDFTALAAPDLQEYQSEYYQQLGWNWFGVNSFTLAEIEQEHQAFFAHAARAKLTFTTA
jgi:hypothetical protein